MKFRRTVQVWKLLSVFGYTLLFRKSMAQNCCCCEAYPVYRIAVLRKSLANLELKYNSATALAEQKLRFEIEENERIQGRNKMLEKITVVTEQEEPYVDPDTFKTNGVEGMKNLITVAPNERVL